MICSPFHIHLAYKCPSKGCSHSFLVPVVILFSSMHMKQVRALEFLTELSQVTKRASGCYSKSHGEVAWPDAKKHSWFDI